MSEQQEPVFAIEKIYLKDASLEIPNAPQIFLERDNPQVEVGSAFLVAGPYDDVGNQDVVAQKNIRAATIDDMVTATGGAFLGLTLSCARCSMRSATCATARRPSSAAAAWLHSGRAPRCVGT